jgi:hypothetical protein
MKCDASVRPLSELIAVHVRDGSAERVRKLAQEEAVVVFAQLVEPALARQRLSFMGRCSTPLTVGKPRRFTRGSQRRAQRDRARSVNLPRLKDPAKLVCRRLGERQAANR